MKAEGFGWHRREFADVSRQLTLELLSIDNSKAEQPLGLQAVSNRMADPVLNRGASGEETSDPGGMLSFTRWSTPE